LTDPLIHHKYAEKQFKIFNGSEIWGMMLKHPQSASLYFGSAGKESNWVPTKAGGRFKLIFRLYGPDKSFFDKKTWILPDIEVVS
jgi:hypothetical protein